MKLTTITPYWNRSDALWVFLKALEGAGCSEVEHLVIVVGGKLPAVEMRNLRFVGVQREKATIRPSIGFYHNIGAQLANTEWIMKLDVDALPNVQYFHRLLPILAQAREREWFNGGMVFINRQVSEEKLRLADMPLRFEEYESIMSRLKEVTDVPYKGPSASNFICRRDDYVKLGGCDARFKGWGWEDYQQTYVLERLQQGGDPLPGPIGLENVTKRCRDEIVRWKAKQLLSRDPALCLLHRWHQQSKDPSYKTQIIARNNRHVLLDHILTIRTFSNGTI